MVPEKLTNATGGGLRLLVLETLKRLRNRITKMRDQSKANPTECIALEAERRALNIVLHFWEHQCSLTFDAREPWGSNNAGQQTRSGRITTGSPSRAEVHPGSHH